MTAANRAIFLFFFLAPLAWTNPQPDPCHESLGRLKGVVMLEGVQKSVYGMAAELADIIAGAKGPNRGYLDHQQFYSRILRSQDFAHFGELLFPPLLRLGLNDESVEIQDAALEIYSILGRYHEFASEHLNENLRSMLAEFDADTQRKIEKTLVTARPRPSNRVKFQTNLRAISEPDRSLPKLLRVLSVLDERSETSVEILMLYLHSIGQYRVGPDSHRGNLQMADAALLEIEDAAVNSLCHMRVEETPQIVLEHLQALLAREEEMELNPDVGHIPLSAHYAGLVAKYSRENEFFYTEELLAFMQRTYQALYVKYHFDQDFGLEYRIPLQEIGAWLLRVEGFDPEVHAIGRSLNEHSAIPYWREMQFREAAHYVRALRLSKIQVARSSPLSLSYQELLSRFVEQLTMARSFSATEWSIIKEILSDFQQMGQSQKPFALKQILHRITRATALPEDVRQQATQAIWSGNRR